ncbi:hypothetical protein M758_1G250400 [Ceratodon purpureus]|nr:hypothetical protein M758_1G250400 [Ceratodon purpureus]
MESNLFICECGSFLTSKKQYFSHCVGKKHQRYVAQQDFGKFQDVKVNTEFLKNKSFVQEKYIDEDMVSSDDVKDVSQGSTLNDVVRNVNQRPILDDDARNINQGPTLSDDVRSVNQGPTLRRSSRLAMKNKINYHEKSISIC